MKTFAHFLFVACLWSITTYATHTVVLDKQIDLGTDPKTQKALLVKAYAFVQDGEQATASTRWFGVFPYEKDLMFFSIENNFKDLFSVTDLISTQPLFNVAIDPTANEPIIDPTKGGSHSSTVTMEVRLDPQLQIFKEIIILTARGNTRALASYTDKITLKRINEIMEKALDCQGECYIECDDIEKFATLVNSKQMPATAVKLTGMLTFVPMQAILEQVLAAEAAKNEKNASHA